MDKEKLRQHAATSLNSIVASDLPPSEVIDTLTKRVYEVRTLKENYNYVLTGIFKKEMTMDGTKDYNYELLNATAGTSPYADTVIGDFNANTNTVLRETFEAKTEYNYKTKMLSSILANFKTNPYDTIVQSFKGAENILKTQELQLEREYWTKIEDVGTRVDVSAETDDIAVNKVIYERLLAYKTTSRSHLGVGNGATDGEITIGENTITPAYRFDSSEFYLITTPEFETNTVFEGERSFFNWNGKQLPIAGKIVLDIPKYEGMTAEVKTSFANVKAMLIHKERLETIMDWIGGKLTNGPKLYDIMHNWIKQDVYAFLNKPALIFDATETPETMELKTQKITEQERENFEQKKKELLEQKLLEQEVDVILKKELDKKNKGK